MIKLVEEKEIVGLPVPAIVAFAARCARKVQHLYQIPEPVYTNEHPEVGSQDVGRNSVLINTTIEFAERVAQLNSLSIQKPENSLGDVVRASNFIRSFAIKGSREFAASDHTPGPNDTCIWYDHGLEDFAHYVLAAANAARACKAAEQAYQSALAASRKDSRKAARAACQAARAAEKVDDEASGESHWQYAEFKAFDDSSIRNEFELLQIAANRENWTDETPVSPRFFSPDSPIERQVMLAVNDLCVKLCELIARDGSALNYIDWRLLEQIIATVLKGIGFEVILTPGSKDGGKDVIAQCIMRGTRAIYYLEIKHWRSNKQVGTRDIFHFVEVNVKDGTNGGLFLSSSGFAPTVYAQLSEITRRRIRLGNDAKIISLCQHFVQKRQNAIWVTKDVLPQILFDQTLGDEPSKHI